MFEKKRDALGLVKEGWNIKKRKETNASNGKKVTLKKKMGDKD